MSMINSLRLGNIKGFVDTDVIEIKPITLVIGQNSSGKSSVLRFPLVLKQTMLDDSMAPLLFYGKSIDYGSYEDVVFSHKHDNKITFTVEYDPFNNPNSGYTDYYKELLHNKFGKFKTFIMSVEVSKIENSILVDRFVLETDRGIKAVLIELQNDLTYTIAVKSGGGNKSRKIKIDSKDLIFDKFIPDFRFIVNDMYNEGKNNLRSFRDMLDLSSYLSSHWIRIANSIQYIGPFRRTPERSYRHKDNAVWHVGGDGSFAPDVLAQDYRSGGNLVQNVSRWLQEHLGFKLKINNLGGEMFRIMIEDLRTGATNNLIDVGHGLSQLIPIVIQVFMPKYYRNLGRRITLTNDDLIVVEQPELHLHPAAQASLADLFIDGIKTNSNGGKNSKRYFMIETHSEHMILRFRRYIVEGKIRPDQIAIYYTSKDKETGSTRIRKLQVKEDGTIPDWPEGFFAEDYNELLLLRQALKNKFNQGENLW